ncbi:tautomerase family protein [Phenylobacterium sp.]|uniref:tautomerase family protein n=1 Tax=Phenylobacterium sp. TaxID=1871053 RepID=UPI002FC620AD
MPNIVIRTPEGVFDAEARARLAKAVTDVAKTVEQGGDDPQQAALTWVLIDEFKPGTFFAGGADPLERLIPIVVFFHYPAGVLDDVARADAARLLQEAISAAKPVGDPRPVMTSVLMREVADGTWGGGGAIWRLPDLAKAAGYKHLQHLIAP